MAPLEAFAKGVKSASKAACVIVNLLNAVQEQLESWERLFPYLHHITLNTKSYNGSVANTKVSAHQLRSAELDPMFVEKDLKNWAQGAENNLNADRCAADPRYLVNLFYTALHENQEVSIMKCTKEAKNPALSRKHLERIFENWQSSSVGCKGALRRQFVSPLFSIVHVLPLLCLLI